MEDEKGGVEKIKFDVVQTKLLTVVIDDVVVLGLSSKVLGSCPLYWVAFVREKMIKW